MTEVLKRDGYYLEPVKVGGRGDCPANEQSFIKFEINYLAA